jgi:hypothetical protein
MKFFEKFKESWRIWRFRKNFQIIFLRFWRIFKEYEDFSRIIKFWRIFEDFWRIWRFLKNNNVFEEYENFEYNFFWGIGEFFKILKIIVLSEKMIFILQLFYVEYFVCRRLHYPTKTKKCTPKNDDSRCKRGQLKNYRNRADYITLLLFFIILSSSWVHSHVYDNLKII